MNLLIDKYRPSSLKEIIGHDAQLRELVNYVKNKKPVIIYGKAGNGKTASIYALAKDLSYEIFEFNSSEVRNKENVEKTIGSSLNQRSLFSKSKIILIDEIDNFSGAKDRGGVQALAKLITNSAFPIVMTSNDPYDKKLSDLRKKCQLINFEELKEDDVVRYLENLCKKEKIKFENGVLNELARINKNDLRGCINDLQILISKDNLKLEDIDLLGKREKEDDILNSLKVLFKGKNPEEVLNVFENVNLDLDECFLWIEENLPLEYKGDKLSKALDYLSKAKVFDGRIRRWQYWRFLIYVNALMTLGINSLKNENDAVNYKRSMRPLKIWQANIRNAKKKGVAEKIADKTHTSVKQVLKNFEDYKGFIDNSVSEELELNDEEVDWLKNF
ncbi:MAG TPA: replication factor C large subunit [Candidatus Nanoarchaeia archaeon]|nr:replication factor C large subunit [Candidatus Nanoarchaeia archaeon]